MAQDYDENETVYRGRQRDGLSSAITVIARFEKF